MFPGWRPSRPGGGLSLWIDLGAPVSSRFTVAARRRDVLLAAGPRFGVDGAFERYLRLPYTLRRDRMDAAVDRLALAWRELDRAGAGGRRRADRGGLTARECGAVVTISGVDHVDESPGGAALAGPLAGLRVVELAGLGPGPHAAMILADLGADVVRVDRPSGGLQLGSAGRAGPDAARPPPGRGRPEGPGRPGDGAAPGRAGRRADRGLPARASPSGSGVGPGRLPRPQPAAGLRPDDRLGPGRPAGRARRARHQLHLADRGRCTRSAAAGERPVPPLNLVGDFGGGSMLLVVGVLAALWEAQRSGQGQVVDAAMVDGASLLAQLVWALRGAAASGPTSADGNLLDGHAPFYDTYTSRTAGTWRSARSSRSSTRRCWPGSELDPAELPAQLDRAGWPALRARFAAVFADPRPATSGPRSSRGTDACVTPVLAFGEVAGAPAPRRAGHDRRAATAVSPRPRRRRGSPAPRRAAARPTAPEPVDQVLADWHPADRPVTHARTALSRSRSARKCRSRVGAGGGGIDGREDGVVDQQVAGAVRVDRDARAHRGGDGDLLQVPALGGGRLGPQHLVQRGGVVLDQLLGRRTTPCRSPGAGWRACRPGS